jgi:3-deoxy-D-manno-octulosonic-acid transferase
MIEPAGFGVPVCVGPNTWNFQDTVERLLEQQGIAVVMQRQELLATWRRWLERPGEAQAIGERAQQFLLAQQGSVDRTLQAILDLASTPTVERRRSA